MVAELTSVGTASPEVSASSEVNAGLAVSPAPPSEVLFDAELADAEPLDSTRSWPFRVWFGTCRAVEWLFGLLCMVIGLGVAASIPLLQFVSLGYLLEISGRISRSGRLRDGFLEIRQAARVGSLLLGTRLMLLPLQMVAELRYSATVFAPDSGIARGWEIGQSVATWVMVAHILLAWYCGGRLRHFFWPLLAPIFFAMWLGQRIVSGAAGMRWIRVPLQKISPRLLRDLTTVPSLNEWFPPAIIWTAIRRGRVYAQARDAVWEFVAGLRLPYYFWLGLRGFVGAVIWLFAPILMIICTTKLSLANPQAAQGLGAILGLVGSFLLAAVILYLPFVQAHFAAERRFGAMFEVKAVRQLFRQAPIAFWFSLLVTLLFALPLYLLKVAVIPREVVWLPSLVFVAFILPARFITGWAVGRARHHSDPRHFLFRWASRLAGVPIAATYVFIVYFTQYTSWYGSWSLFEQHAFLVPVPFLSL